MFISLFCLSFGSIFFGYILKDIFVGLGTDVWQNSIFNLYENISILDSEFLPASIKLIPVIFSFFGVFFFFFLYLYFFNGFILNLDKNFFLNIYKFLSKK
jgi:NADH-ubiquinone oxidoreductase chain 5